MVRWLTRREKIYAFEARLDWLRHKDQQELPPPPKERFHLAKEPSARSVSFADLVQEHGAERFQPALQTFIAQYRDPSRTGYDARVSDRRVVIPFGAVDVWHHLKFNTPSVQSSKAPDTNDTADAYPRRYNKSRKRYDNARFDTILVNDDNAQETTIKGKSNILSSLLYPNSYQ